MSKFIGRGAFSLIELLIVIAIMGLLAAVAVPSYNQYQLKAKVSNGVTVMQGLAAKAMAYYNATGSFPSSLQVGSVSVPINNASWVDVSSANLPMYHVLYKASNPPTSTQAGVEIAATIRDLSGISGYVAPSGAFVDGNSNVISVMMASKTNGTIFSACGAFDNSFYQATSIPTKYYPAICTCTRADIYWQNSVPGTSC